MYKNIYNLTMTFKNPQYRSKLNDLSVQKQIQVLVTQLNSYYRNATKQQVSLKKHLKISFVNNEMLITLRTENPLPNPQRRGQCMRQFSILLLKNGFGQFLTSYDPKKLLSS